MYKKPQVIKSFEVDNSFNDVVSTEAWTNSWSNRWNQAWDDNWADFSGWVAYA